MSETYVAQIAFADFDVSLLPAASRQPGTEEFRLAVTAFIEKEFKRFVGWVQILVEKDRIRVAWRREPQAPDPLDEAVMLLQRGDHARGVLLLKLIAPSRPGDAMVHYNLGMALSDTGKLDEAEQSLRTALEIKPDFTNARIALGVAIGRQGRYSDGEGHLVQAVLEEPNNPYALRNLGVCLVAQKKRLADAESHLRKATQLAPDDQIAWTSLGQALMALDRQQEADAALRRAVDINPHSRAAEAAKRELSRLAQASFRSRVEGGLRMDAVMCCLEAIRKFENLPAEEIQKVAFEAAALGTKGVDPHDPSPQYELRSLSGKFTGLALLCYMYVAFKRVAPDANIGFDVAREYEAALGLHKGT